MKKDKLKRQALQKRHRRNRYKILSVTDKPRLVIYRGIKNIIAQIVDDRKRKVILACSTFSKEFKQKLKYGGNIKAATLLGGMMAEKAKAMGITTVVFDRSGYKYHGRVKAVAEAARKAGLNF